jgi:transcription-repair coupling factor (superfamily II helicase)
VVPINLDVPGEAHLPKEYVEADDARLEAYRRLASVTSEVELDDLASEWIDRYGALPAATQGLLELARLRLACLRLAVTSVAVLPARVGVRSKPVLKMGPLSLTLSQQLRARRTHGSSAYNETTKELRLELAPNAATSAAILSLLEELYAPTMSANG